jgi:hypothetical protein
MTCVRSVLSERSDGNVDQPRIDGAQRLEAEAARGHRPGGGVLEDEVGAGDQVQELVARRFAIEVESDAALAAVEGVEVQTLEPRRQSRVERPREPRRAAARRLDLDHVGAQSSQNERSELRARIGQVQHPVWTQHRGVALARARGRGEAPSPLRGHHDHAR